MRGQKRGSQKQNENKRQRIPGCVLAGYILGNAVVWGALLVLYPLLGAALCWMAGTFLQTVSAVSIALYLRHLVGTAEVKTENPGGQFYAMSVNARQYMLQLLQRDMVRDGDMEQLLEQSGIRFAHPYYCAAVLKIDDYGMISDTYSSQDIGLFTFSMGNIAAELLGEHMTVYHTENGAGCLTFIMNMEHIPNPGWLAEIFRDAILHESDYFGIGFSAGIGTVAEGILTVSESYNNALDAVEYRFFRGKQSVTEYESIRAQESVHIDYPYDMEREILRQAIRFHNRVKTMEYLDEFVERIGQIAAEDAGMYIHQLGVAVNRALRQAEGITVSHLYSMREFSSFMETLTTIREKQQQIKATLDELFQIAAEDSGRKKQQVVQCVEEFITQNYQNPDITLEDMAMCAGLSSNYIRRIFREQCGYSPMDYLVGYRIEAAKELLKNTSHTAKEVAGMVGYVNTKYFYSLFKKQTGYTTFEYKKKMEQES